MITKETARQIFNCYSQMEAIEKLKKDMAEEVQKVREREEKRKMEKPFEEPIPEGSFGKFGKGMQLGIPEGIGHSMRIFNISPELAIKVMDEHLETLKKEMDTLEAVANVEMCLVRPNAGQ